MNMVLIDMKVAYQAYHQLLLFPQSYLDSFFINVFKYNCSFTIICPHLDILYNMSDKMLLQLCALVIFYQNCTVVGAAPMTYCKNCLF